MAKSNLNKKAIIILSFEKTKIDDNFWLIVDPNLVEFDLKCLIKEIIRTFLF